MLIRRNCRKCYRIFLEKNLVNKRYRSTVSEGYVRHKILSEKGKNELVERISKLKYKTLNGKKRQSAGVLVPLCIVNGSLSLLFTIRSTALSGYSGQISFPGGKMEQSDSSVVDAALRETSEETGILKQNIDVWVNGPTFPDRQGKYHVTPVVGYVGDIDIQSLNYNKEEVSEIISMPITQLLNPDVQRYTTFRTGWTMPVFRTHTKNIWGITSTITEMFLATVFMNEYKKKLHIFDRSKKISHKFLDVG